MARDRNPTLRVGGLIVVALIAFMLGVMLIGEQNNLFRPMNHYSVRFTNVRGLQAGNPVQLSGVAVGRVLDIELPVDPGEDSLVVTIAVDRRFGERMRGDSTARIQTLGLLGDKFVALTSGSQEFPKVPHDGEIPAAATTDVDRLIASGEGVMENALAISASLSRLLQQLEKGDSVLGMLMAPLPDSDRERSVWETLFSFLNAMDRISMAIEAGEGPMARLLLDGQMADQMAGSIARLERLLTRIDEGEGLLPKLIDDRQLTADVEAMITDLRATAGRFSALGARLDEQLSDQGDGLLPRLLYDEALADEITDELRLLFDRLDKITAELTEGEGTAAMLLNDRRVYEAVNDIIIGIDESRLLRWLVRNRQKAGIEERYRRQQESAGAAGETAPAAEAEGADPVAGEGSGRR